MNDKCIQSFCSFICKHNAESKIILTSSWKTGYSSIPANETEQLQEWRTKLGKYGVKLSGRTKSLQNRMQEIDDYIANHDVESYAIIDDDSNEFSSDYLKKFHL